MSYLITLSGTIVMSRLLNPSEFGLFGMLTVLSSLASVVVGMGFAQAIVQNQFLKQEDLSSIFWLSFFLGLAIALLFFLSASAIADFYEQPQLVEISRFFSLIFLIYGCSSVPLGILSKRIAFKELVISQLCAALISYGLGIVAAYKGWGVWSLIIQAIANHFIYVILNVYFSRWRPSFHFKIVSIAKIGKFSRNFLPSQLLDFFALNLDVLLIGKFFGKNDLGHFTRAGALVQLPVNSLGLIFNKTFFSVFAALQDDKGALSGSYIRVVKLLTLSLMPILILIGIVADKIVLFLFGPAWVETAPLVSILAVSAAIGAYNNFNDSVIVSQGRTDLLLMVNVAEKIVLITGVLIGLRFGLLGIVWAKVIASAITFIPKLYVLTKVTNVSWYVWIYAQRFLFIGLLICGISGNIISGLSSVLLIDLAAIGLVGVVSMVAFLWVVKESSLFDFKGVIKKFY